VLVELGVVEQRYDAVKEVLDGGGTVTEVAERYGVTRQSLHNWIRRYQERGMAGLVDRSKRPRSCPHRTPARSEIRVIELRREHPRWGPRRLAYELARTGAADPVPSRSSIYRILVRSGLVEPRARRRKRSDYIRWERARPMELWQLDVVEARLEGGSAVKILTGVDDHSRFCVVASAMPRATARPVCEAFAQALRAYGVPQAVLTDNGRVFSGRHARARHEVLFDRICRENGIRHLLTAVRSPTTTGKIERFHRTLRDELFSTRSFSSVAEVQRALDHYVAAYNTLRPHQALGMATPIERFSLAGPQAAPLTGALEEVQEGEVITDARHDHIRRVDINGRIHFAGARYYAGSGLARDSVTVRVVDDEVRILYRGELMRSYRRRHPREKEEVIYSHHRRQSNRTIA
jgi:transposase InsO family protein